MCDFKKHSPDSSSLQLINISRKPEDMAQILPFQKGPYSFPTFSNSAYIREKVLIYILNTIQYIVKHTHKDETN